MRRVTIIVAVIVFAGLVFLATVKTQRWVASPMKTSSDLTSAIETAVAPATGAGKDRKLPPRIDGEEVTLRPTGFFPNEIRRKKEPFILTVNNLTGLDDLSFQLARDNGERQSEKTLQGQITWRQLLDLNPGRYILKEENHPEWVCHLIIIAK